MEKQINNIINYINTLCSNELIIRHVKRLITDYCDYITEISDRCIRANRDADVMEINISKNCFTIYSTSWSYSSRKSITFFKADNCTAISFSNSEITNEGSISNVYKYVFNNDILTWTTYSKKVNLEYELCGDIKKIKKDEYVEIYPITDLLALKKVKKNDEINYFTTHINKVNINDIGLFSFIYSNMDEKVIKEEYEKIKVIK